MGCLASCLHIPWLLMVGFGQLPSGSYSSSRNCEDSQRTSELVQIDSDSVILTSDSPAKSATGLEA